MISSTARFSTRILGANMSRAVAAARPFALGTTDVTSRSFQSPSVRRFNRKNRVKQQPAMSALAKEPSNVPTMEMARSVETGFSQMDNNTLVLIAHMDNHDARSELLKRHIMSVDNVSYEEAGKTFDTMAAKNQEGMLLISVPYIAGVSLGCAAAAASFPMVFDLGTATWFNKYYVTTEVPDAHDLETWLEVGSWTWNWMEPPLGQISFVLLCLQFSRAQMLNLGIRPYTSKVKQMRAARLSSAFPQYDKKIVEDFSETDSLFVDPFHGK